MIYISAQPDTYYFLWQLQIQLFNFNRLGIKPKDIHVLICYNKEKGLSACFQVFIKENKRANFFAYPDTRIGRLYDSSLRPHIIAKHFKANPWLEKEAVFYHDSDIIFTHLPDFNRLLHDDFWYASDTRSYNDSKYIKGKIGYIGFRGMAKLIGLSTQLIEQHDENMGGAQYLLKNVTTKFWKTLEKNCEKLYEYLNDLNNQQGEKGKQIQAWCTDMWCLWWQAIKMDEKIKIHAELDFMWANTPILKNGVNSILHYTGDYKDSETRYFRKNNYCRCPPFFDDFASIDQTSASTLLVEEIKKYNQCQLADRIDLSDVSFLISVRIDSEERLENLRIVTNHLHQQFKTNTIILEADNEQKVDISKLPHGVDYHFVKDDNSLFYPAKYNDQLIALSNTPIIVLYDTNVVLQSSQIIESIQIIRKECVPIVYPYSDKHMYVDLLMKTMFAKLMDIEIFEKNNGKHKIIDGQSYNGCVFLDKQRFLLSGEKREALRAIEASGIDIKKRMQVLGYRIENISGDIYHLSKEEQIHCSVAEIHVNT